MTNSKPFEWTDELVKEFGHICRHNNLLPDRVVASTYTISDWFEQFKQSKSLSSNLSDGWQIIACRDSDGKLWYTDMIPTKGETIEAVKRISDNVVLSVHQDTPYGKIKAFEINDAAESGMWVVIDKDNMEGRISLCTIKLPTNPIPDTPVKVEVSNITDVERYDGSMGIIFSISKPVFSDKFPAIKQAIENVLNGERRLYSQGQVDTMMEDTWKAARRLSEIDYHHTPYKYRSLPDYKNSLQPAPVQPQEKISTNNDDVACLSLNDVVETIQYGVVKFMQMPHAKFIKDELMKKVKEKLKQ